MHLHSSTQVQYSPNGVDEGFGCSSGDHRLVPKAAPLPEAVLFFVASTGAPS